MSRWSLFACLLFAAGIGAAQSPPVAALVLSVDPTARTLTVSIDAANGSPARKMRLAVPETAALERLAPGVMIEFTPGGTAAAPRAEHLRVVPFENTQPDPFAASRLAVLGEIVAGRPPASLMPGSRVPDFTLTDQRRRPISLADFRGKVVALNFVYTSCALPDFCLRLANHFNVLQKRFPARLGTDLILLTISFDPVHDTPEVLASYAAQWDADPASWHFLTGREDLVREICRRFGVQAFANEGLLDHSLHSVVIDRQGILVANLEGNRFSATQFADLVEDTLR